MRPGSPMVVRNCGHDIARATAIRSWLRMIFDTAATISGVSPGEPARTWRPRRRGSRSEAASPGIRRQSTARPARRRRVVAVDDQPGDFVGLVRERACRRGTPTAASRPTATRRPPARRRTRRRTRRVRRPTRSGVAFAIRSTSPSNWYVNVRKSVARRSLQLLLRGGEGGEFLVRRVRHQPMPTVEAKYAMNRAKTARQHSAAVLSTRKRRDHGERRRRRARIRW